jgi:hypothetical protein
MPNDYYNHGVYPSPNSPGSSSQLRAELDSIAAGFNKLPTLTANGNKFVRVNAAGTLLETIATIPVGSGGTGLSSYTADGALYANGTGTALLSGTLPVISGGTGQTSYASNGALYANGAGTAILSGALPVVSGGTGASTAAGARANILPSFTGNANKALVVNPGETDVAYSLINLSAVTGVLPVANGGTNSSTASGARVNLLPSFAGKSGYALVINGSETDVEFLPAPGIGLPVQANEGGTGLTSPGALGNLLTSTGTGWASLPPPITGPSTAKTYFMGQF